MMMMMTMMTTMMMILAIPALFLDDVVQQPVMTISFHFLYFVREHFVLVSSTSVSSERHPAIDLQHDTHHFS